MEEQAEQETEEEATAERLDPEQTPGAVLKAERERQGLSEVSVANDLHITAHYVKAIESNAFDKLPGDIFARGYIKSYAVLLQLEPAGLIEAYNTYTAARNETQMEAARKVRERKKRDKNRPWIIFSGIAFVAVAVALWWFSTAGEEIVNQPPREQNPTRSQGVAGSADPNDDNSRTGSPQFEASESQSATDAATGSDTDPAADPVVAAADEYADSVAEEELVPASEEESLGFFRLIEVDADGSDVLELKFSGESWVEVDDRNDIDVYGEMRVAGDLLRITGRAPFNVLLGHAPAVRLSLNGSNIDVSSSIRVDQSARVTVGF